jgi:glycogen(starch) synthase
LMQEDFFHMYPQLAAQQKPYVVAYPGASVPVTSQFVDDWVRPSNAPFTFLFVGRGYRKKGLDIVLAAAAKLARTGRYFRLLIAGLEAKPLYLIRIQLMGLQNHVQYLGFRNDMDVVYRMADAAILPSRVEPFGMAPLQAMAFGLVPIISRVSGVSEVLQHDRDCLIVENHVDTDELASHMARLMDQPRLLAELSRNARQAAGQINWEQTVERTLDAYAIARRVPAKVGATVQ